MFGRKTQVKVDNSKYDLMVKGFEKFIAGDYSLLDEETFPDKEVAQKVNEIIMTFMKSNNNFVMRANEAMESIGDNSYVKDMLDQVVSQRDSINDMESSSTNLENSIQNINLSVEKMRTNTHNVLEATRESADTMQENVQIINESADEIVKINEQVQNFYEKINKISEIVDMVKQVASQSNLLALNASIEAARAGEAGKGFAVVADQVRELSSNTSASADDIVKYVNELQQSISGLAETMDATTKKLGDGSDKIEKSINSINDMADQMKGISSEIDSIYDAVDRQSEVTRAFSGGIRALTDSYDVLYDECHKTGEHIFKIGRYIDTLRSDMYRGFSKVTLLDSLRVFEIDHFILTWRVYNNAVGFESLKLTQLNNPTSCKLGKWLAAQTDQELTGSTQFKDVSKLHKKLHDKAVKSWEAKDRGDEAQALAYFADTLESFYEYRDAIRRLQDFERSRGYGEETEIVVFGK